MESIFYTTEKAEDAAEFLAQSIVRELGLHKRVLWFVTGGSSIAVATLASKILSGYHKENPHLTIMLTDERYGPLGHPDSNWRQLEDGGFSLPWAKSVPILTGDDRNTTNQKFNTALKEELHNAEYRIGLFGIGADGHTAGILPGSPAVDAPGWSFAYSAGAFERITITPKTIVELDEVVAFVQGKEKWKVMEDLKKNNLDIHKQPAQILKKVPLLKIFTNYKTKG